MARKHLAILVRGLVQGVSYRASTQEMALELGLVGIVRNEPDGSVYIEAEGEEAMLARLVEWCHRGPDFARVTDVTVTDGPLQAYDDFLIAWK